MDKNKEIGIIQRELKIPVTDIDIFLSYMEITSGKEKIGTIPYTVAGINTYNTDANVINWLKWDQVYFQNQETIDSMIKKVIGREDIQITILTFRRLNVKEKETGINICAVTCSYDGQWNVERE
jgi:hypothetical protein